MLRQCSLVTIIMGGMTTCTKKDNKGKQGITKKTQGKMIKNMRKDDKDVVDVEKDVNMLQQNKSNILP